MAERFGRIALAAAMLLASACGDDSEGQPCPEGTLAGAMLQCQCEDGTTGISVCNEALELGPCECGDAPADMSGDGDGDGDTGGGDGDAPPPGGDTSTPGTGDGDGDGSDGMADADGGVDDPMTGGDGDGTGDGGGDPGVVVPPSDGTQLALCSDDRDCNRGLGCSGRGPGQGFCSATCANTSECEALGDGFECGPGGVCEATCAGADDDSCPMSMECVSVSMSFPLPGGGEFNCQYPERIGQELSPAWGPCEVDEDCDGDRMCVGGMGGFPPVQPAVTGFCSNSCEQTSECAAAPDGSITPSCEATGIGGGLCELDCFGDQDGCPSGMTCQLKATLGMRCEY